MKTMKIGRFATLQFGSEGNDNASSVNNKEENKMFNKSQMSHDAQGITKGGRKMKRVLKEKGRFFKEAASFASNSFKAGWNGEDFDAESFVEERGFDTLLTKEYREAKAKAAEVSSKAAKKEEERKDFYASLGEPSEPKEAEVETPVKEEESAEVDETVVEETTQKPEEALVVTEGAEVTEEETPGVDKVRPVNMKASKLFNHVGKFGAEGIRRVKGGYQRTKGKVLGLAKSGFKHNISKNAKMLGAGILAMYSGLILGIESVYIFGLLTMILSLRVVLPVVLILGLIEVQVMFAEKARKEEANA